MLKSFLATLKNKKGIERNLLAKKYIQKIIYSKQSINIALFYHKQSPVFNRIYTENPKDFQKSACQQSTALLSQGGAEIFSEAGADQHSKELAMPVCPITPEKDKFVVENTSARKNEFQTFNIILPNLIHKSRKMNLKK